MKLWIDEEAVFVTNNESDFVALCREVDLHTGLLVLPQADSREAQWPLLDAALDHIEKRALDEGESAASLMLNRRVEVVSTNVVVDEVLPEA